MGNRITAFGPSVGERLWTLGHPVSEQIKDISIELWLAVFKSEHLLFCAQYGAR